MLNISGMSLPIYADVLTEPEGCRCLSLSRFGDYLRKLIWSNNFLFASILFYWWILSKYLSIIFFCLESLKIPAPANLVNPVIVMWPFDFWTKAISLYDEIGKEGLSQNCNTGQLPNDNKIIRTNGRMTANGQTNAKKLNCILSSPRCD
jgi:hypothetical protein